MYVHRRSKGRGYSPFYRRSSRKTDGIRRRILHSSSGQQHPSPSQLALFLPYRWAKLMTRFQGALYVYYVGYGVKEMPPPALVPITLQPQHGSTITVQSDSYRPAGAQGQIILFRSNKLNPTETYTITVTKTNATLAHGVNIDSFIITQQDRADSPTSSSDTNFFASGVYVSL
jgi:hypothetical protein